MNIDNFKRRKVFDALKKLHEALSTIRIIAEDAPDGQDAVDLINEMDVYLLKRAKLARTLFGITYDRICM